VSNNGDVATAASRIDEPEAAEETPPFPAKPKSRYVLKVEYARERVIAWTAIKEFHGEKNGNVKERDRELAIGTRNGILYKSEIDRATGKIVFERGWMIFQTGAQIDHLLKCFAWQLSDEGPGIPLEGAVLADDIIAGLKVLSAKWEADHPPVEKPKAKPRGRSRSRS
jgi:hypothetical protein